MIRIAVLLVIPRIPGFWPQCPVVVHASVNDELPPENAPRYG